MGSKRRIARAVFPLALVCIAFGLGATPAQASLTYQSSFGGSGTGAGQFSQATGVAVNYATGDVYVADELGNRLEQFSADGTFIRMWGKGVNQTTPGNVCPVNPGDVCKAGIAGGESGQFANPRGVAVDNSSGPAEGSVYVLDADNNRIQRFTASGQFVLMWGKGVDSTGGDICTAASGHVCQAGGVTKTSVHGQFSGWGDGSSGGQGPRLAIDGAGSIYVGDPKALLVIESNAIPRPRVEKFDPTGAYVSQIAGPRELQSDRGLENPTALAVNPSGEVYVDDAGPIKVYQPSEFTDSGSTARWSRKFGEGATITLDPTNNFLLVAGSTESFSGEQYICEFLPSGAEVDCTTPTAPPIENGDFHSGPIAASADHKLYVVNFKTNLIQIYQIPVATNPGVGLQRVSEITSTKAVFKTEIAANLAETTFHIDWGTSPCSVSTCAETPESAPIGASTTPLPVATQANTFKPGTTYYYRFVAHNSAGTTAGPDRSFTTFVVPSSDPSCPNNLARQQTGAAFLLDCRAYELVSAEDTGGYNVESDVTPGQVTPFGGYPLAGGKALYAVHSGVIPGPGKPTNRGPDPYVATRDAAHQRWNTEYVGIPADAPSAESFASTVAGADDALGSFAFNGPEICNPCFPGGGQGIPVHRPGGALIQGMAGSIPVAEPVSAGEVKKPLSGDGSHFVFGSKQQFELAGNSNATDVTIYDRNLSTDATQVVSTLPDGSTIEAGSDVAELDVSRDGSHVLIGVFDHADSAGNRYWHLYMHVGSSPESVDLTPTTAEGVLYDGMTTDGSAVYFTSTDAYAGDGDTSADLFRAAVGASSSTLTRVSTGAGLTGDTDGCDPAANSYNTEDWNTAPGGPTDCSIVAVGGGGGVAEGDGTVYFLSPERLDGSEGVDGAPNLYIARPGSPPHFVATLESTANAPFPEASHNFVGSFGTYVNPSAAAIDHASGSTYVMDTLEADETPGPFVQKLDASGNVDLSFGVNGKIDHSSPGHPFLEYGSAFGFPVPLSLAVDNKVGSPSYRDLYVVDTAHEEIQKFDSEGHYLSTISTNFPTGVDVDQATGNVYAVSFSGYKIYSPTGAFLEAVNGLGFAAHDIAVNSSGEVFITGGGAPTERYSAAGAPEGVLDPNPSYGVRVDPADGHVYVDEGSRVVEYDPSGAVVGQPIGVGKISGSVGFAVDGGRLVVGNPNGDNVVEFSAPVTPASRSYDAPLVIDSVRQAETRHTADFQITPNGDVAAFASTLPLKGFASAGKYEIFRYDSPGTSLLCLTCNPTGAEPETDASLAVNGRSLSDDGRVFFTSGEPLVLRDADSVKDAYEWSDGTVELISTAQSSSDSGLLSVSADGTDALFFTRESITSNDRNGNLTKLYDARENGGFFVVPPTPACAASDECHGAGTVAPPPPNIGTVTGTLGNVGTTTEKCKKGFVKKHGKCVKKHRKHHRKHHPARTHG